MGFYKHIGIRLFQFYYSYGRLFHYDIILSFSLYTTLRIEIVHLTSTPDRLPQNHFTVVTGFK
jgi:hypothetical protein